MAEPTGPLLAVECLVTGYGKKQILSGVTLDIAPGEIVALIGHNGAGKSTFLKAVFGLLPIWSGSIVFYGTRLKLPVPRQFLQARVAYVPQGNRVFTDLTVQENLDMAGIALHRGAQLKDEIERVFTLFPLLKLRVRQRAGTLSGGEKQMLALANALIISPRLLLLDEPSLGLARPLVCDVLENIRQISIQSGAAVVVVEQKVREVLKIAQRVYVLKNGNVSFSGPADLLREEAKLHEVYL